MLNLHHSRSQQITKYKTIFWCSRVKGFHNTILCVCQSMLCSGSCHIVQLIYTPNSDFSTILVQCSYILTYYWRDIALNFEHQDPFSQALSQTTRDTLPDCRVSHKA